MSVIKTTLEDHIAIITINRPEAYNAMNPDVIESLENQINEFINDDNVGVIILTGAGDKAFVAGADIKRMNEMTQKEALEFGKSGQHLTLTIENSPKPIIAAVNGFALGGGCEISLACHIRVASESAQFGQPEVLLGILPGWGGTQRLPRIVGIGLANELIATGRRISAQEAKDIGLVNHVVEQDKLIQKCKDISIEILKNGPNAIAKSLQCIRYGIGRNLDEGLKFEVKAFSSLFDKPESKEGLIAFVEKRKAKFR